MPFRILPLHEVDQYVNSVPLYDIGVAAGNFSESQSNSDFNWVELPKPYLANKDYFVCKVVGDSMNKIIPNGSWCLFKKDPGGSREGKIVLVEHYAIQDSDFGSGFTVKLYHSEKKINQDNWSHKKIILKPQSSVAKYKEIVLHENESDGLKVVGIFVGVLE
jgi:phage repressor protein C with HTH and peptisase S24 domain